MTELHVLIPDDLAKRLSDRAALEHMTPEQLATEAVRSYIGPGEKSGIRKLGFIGLGDSGRSDISEYAEEILRADFGA